jgi:integrase
VHSGCTLSAPSERKKGILSVQAVINNSLLVKLKPREKSYDVRDEKLKGFILRVQRTGGMFYRCEYARGKRVSLGSVSLLTPAQARDKAREILSQARLGIDMSAKKPRDQMTLTMFIDMEYAAWRLANRKNGKADLARLKVNFINEMGDRLLSDISPIVIEKWRTNRINNGTRIATVNRDIVILKSALAKAVEWEFIKEHPLKQFKLHKIDSVAKVRYLLKDEEINLKNAIERRDQAIKIARASGNEWRAARSRVLFDDLSKCVFADHVAPMILLSLNTGLRRGELFNLAWEHVDLDRAILTISGEVSKSGKTRHIPLNAIALKVLHDWRQQTSDDGLVFVNSNTGKMFDNVNKAWDGILTAAGIENFRWHDMRHHFASKLVMKGVDLNTVRELLGHSDIKMTLRYAHLAPEHKASAVAKLVE